MANKPRFLIAFNPLAEQGVKYVIHTQKPRFVARYTPGAPLSDFEIVDDIDGMYAFFSNDVNKVAGLMRRLGDWMYAYLKWEAENDRA